MLVSLVEFLIRIFLVDEGGGTSLLWDACHCFIELIPT